MIMIVHAIHVQRVGMQKSKWGTQPYPNVFCVVLENSKIMRRLSLPLSLIVKTVHWEDTLTTRELSPKLETGI